MSQPMLDPKAIERLHRIGGDNLVRSMMTSFIENAAARMAAARAGAQSGDARAVSDAAHALKSSAGNVGATSLQMVAQKVEREALEEGASLDALVAELGAELDGATTAAAWKRDEAAG